MNVSGEYPSEKLSTPTNLTPTSQTSIPNKDPTMPESVVKTKVSPKIINNILFGFHPIDFKTPISFVLS